MFPNAVVMVVGAPSPILKETPTGRWSLSSIWGANENCCAPMWCFSSSINGNTFCSRAFLQCSTSAVRFSTLSAAISLCLLFSTAATAIFAVNLSASSWAFMSLFLRGRRISPHNTIRRNCVFLASDVQNGDITRASDVMRRSARRHFPQRRDQRGVRIRLRQEDTAGGQIVVSDPYKTRRCDDLDRWPTVADEPGEHPPVHRTRHLDVGEDDVSIGPRREDRYGFVGVGSLNDFKAGVFDHVGGIHSQQE